VPTQTFIRTLNAARFAADVCGVDTLVIARTDAHSATLITSDVDDYDHQWIDRDSRTNEGFFRLKQGNGHSVEHAIARGVAYAPYSDLVWWETSEPDLGEAREFAREFRRQHPDKLMAYNCSPSFNWLAKMSVEQATRFQETIADMGYRFQFVTLAGFHALNLSMFELASGYRARGMGAYSEMQQREFAAQSQGFTAVRHQREVGTGYFDAVGMAISAGKSSTTAMAGSTETAQFDASRRVAAE
jgi:isocitrate lyase